MCYSIVAAEGPYPYPALSSADKKGSLEIGKDADIVITDCEFNVEKTIIGGEIKYEA